MKRLILLLLAWSALLSSHPAMADEGEGGMAGAFLRISPDPRSAAMGGAYTSVAGGACASIWNPAQLGYLQGYVLETSLARLSMERNLGYITGVAPLSGDAGMGGGWLRAWVDDLPRYDSGGSRVGEFSFSQNAFFLSFGRRIIPQLSAGLTVKFFYHFLDGVGATGLSFDVGIMAKPIAPLSLGLVFQDVHGQETWDSAYLYGSGKKDEIPLTIRGGASYSLLDERLILVGEISGQIHRSPAYHLGLEVWPRWDLALRAGYDDGFLSAGGGLLFPINNMVLSVDYAYTQDSLQVSPGHRFSLGFIF